MDARNELELEATDENLSAVQSFVEQLLTDAGCPLKTQMEISVAVEEIFINIAHYAYAPEKGTARVCVELCGDSGTVTITFADHGAPYDPLARPDPNVTLPAEERGIGGLGVYLTKQLMDEVAYTYANGQNILTMKKKL